MASFVTTSRFFNLTLLIFIFMAPMGFCFQFDVGGQKGWLTPTRDDTEAYNRWAASLRFNIGDTLYFKYLNDSVLEVSEADYKACNIGNPLGRYENGSTVFKFERSGSFYFISGEEEHCNSGQRLIIQVIHSTQEMESSSGPAPSPGPSSDFAGSPSGHTPHAHLRSGSSTINFNVSSFFITTFGVIFVFLYRFV